MKYKIKEEKLIHDGFLKLKKARVNFDGFDGNIEERTFEVVDRGDSSAIVLFETDTNTLLLARQFRLPTVTYSSGWLTELVAGRINEGETPKAAIIREVEEEIGYELEDVKEIGHYVLSPGACTERVFMFYAQVKSKDGPENVHEGLDGEDIELNKVTVEQVAELIHRGDIVDAKTLIGLQWFLSRHRG